MLRQTPKLDSRSAQDIVRLVKERSGLDGGQSDPLGEAIIQIFARYCEIVIERLNQVPEKNYRAFLNELGISRVPPTIAQVPLTFTPAKSVPETNVSVPKYTKVASVPIDGDEEPVVYETIQDLRLTQATLCQVISLQPRRDKYTDHSGCISPGSVVINEPAFKGISPVRHEFFIGVGQEIAGSAQISSLHLKFSNEELQFQPNQQIIEWSILSQAEEQTLIPHTDTTFQLSRSGEIIFDQLPAWESQLLNGIDNYWLRCRLLTPIISSDSNCYQERFTVLPRIGAIEIVASSNINDSTIQSGLFNGLSLDISKDFFPFGERPKFGDVFSICSPHFSDRRAFITLRIELTNPASGQEDSPIPRVIQTGHPKIEWEYWNGQRWRILECHDQTSGLTEHGRVSFKMPSDAIKSMVDGEEDDWIRARLVSGHYGVDQRFNYGRDDSSEPGFRDLASTPAPPAIKKIVVELSLQLGPMAVKNIVTHNNFVFENIATLESAALSPFQPVEEQRPTLYMGFNVPDTVTDKTPDRNILAGRTIDLYFQVGVPERQLFCRRQSNPPALIWQCWNGRNWKQCIVRDRTEAFKSSGVVSLQLSEDIMTWSETSLYPVNPVFWIRAVWQGGNYPLAPVLERILLNTTIACQNITVVNEILGSSNGLANQSFYSARVPIVGDLSLEVREPQIPDETALSTLLTEEGNDAVTITRNTQGQIDDIRIRWHQVDDFLTSSHSDRHFIVDSLSGEIRFGDGSKGLVPPPGANNIRLGRYKSGGGISGNKPPNCVVQLRTSIPSVDSVSNLEAAKGGQEREDWESLYKRGSCFLRHRDRAVTVEDYEDLARRASPDVAQVKCYPLHDLTLPYPESADQPGVISLVIMPRSTEPKPRPHLDLLDKVWTYLNPIRDASADLIVLGPDYVRVSVDSVIVTTSDCSEMINAGDCLKQLDAFLHPITGGINADGWAFGEVPQLSDLYTLLESIPSLKYIRSVQIRTEEERDGLLESGNFFICSGSHNVRIEIPAIEMDLR